jgi:hypothetical protein
VNTYTDFPNLGLRGRNGMSMWIVSRCALLEFRYDGSPIVMVSGNIYVLPYWRLYMGERYDNAILYRVDSVKILMQP